MEKYPLGFLLALQTGQFIALCKSSLPRVESSYRPTMCLPQEVPLFLSFGI